MVNHVRDLNSVWEITEGLTGMEDSPEELPFIDLEANNYATYLDLIN